MKRALTSVLFVLVVVATGIAAAAVITSPEAASAQDEGEQEEVITEDRDDSVESQQGPRHLLAEKAGAFIDEALADLVNDGVITEEQLEAVRDALLAYMAEEGEHLRQRFHQKRGERHQFPGPVPLESLEEMFGVAPQQLFEYLREGLTLPEALEELDIDANEAIDAMVAEAMESIDQAVENGRLDPAQAEQLKARITEAITNMLENGFNFRFRFGPPGYSNEDA